MHVQTEDTKQQNTRRNTTNKKSTCAVHLFRLYFKKQQNYATLCVFVRGKTSLQLYEAILDAFLAKKCNSSVLEIVE